MLLNYSYQTISETSSDSDGFEFVRESSADNFSSGLNDEFRLISDKIRLPDKEDHLFRPRLLDVLSKFSEQTGATIIVGRAGTGKTVLARDFANFYEKTTWFRVEASDLDWKTFSRYFLAAFKEESLNFISEVPPENTMEEEINQFLEILFLQLDELSNNRRFLIVLDDLHCVFDAAWFETFFKSLLSYHLPNIHFMLLSRAKPPFPIWRLRSKQKLSVLEEQLLWFTANELKKIMLPLNIDEHKIHLIHKASYGRISKANELAELLMVHNST